ncbi:hypothetical protein EV127DRAFT_412940 [Xylaria flabelliformis]|nr:hypothetical protein EV127DRAFT_412940 [Xylaria flabelliformis]
MTDESKKPYQPGDEERKLYYYGIAGNPKLVARTSCDAWVKPMHRLPSWGIRFGQTRKHFGPIRDEDEIVSKWTRDLSMMIVEVLEPYPWSYFFPVRIPLGVDDDLVLLSKKKAIEETQPITLLIAVTENSMGWERGIEMALQCRDLLRDHGIAIEVEVREGTSQRSAISADLENQIDETIWPSEKDELIGGQSANTIIAPMLSQVGYPVGYLKDNFSYGTIGLHVVLGDDSKVYGLTCRHVVDSGQPLERIYNVSTEQHKQYHTHGTGCIIAQTLNELRSYQDHVVTQLSMLKTKREGWDLIYSLDPELYPTKRPTADDEALIPILEARSSYYGGLIESLEKQMASSSSERVIGHVAFYPSFKVSARTPGYLTDWALIELDDHKYPKGFINKVVIDRYEGGVMLPCGLLELQPRKIQDDTITKKSFQVAKRGAASKLTFGMTSAIEAVVREPKDDGNHYICWELLIVPYGGKGHFSKRGDSGSCVFDESGDVIGMVVGNSQVNPPDDQTVAQPKHNKSQCDDTTDVTFAAPIDRVFDDIQNFTGFKPRLVGYPE